MKEDAKLSYIRNVLSVYTNTVYKSIYDEIKKRASNSEVSYQVLSNVTDYDLKTVSNAVLKLAGVGLVVIMQHRGPSANSTVIMQRSKSYRVLEMLKSIQIAG